MIRVSAHHAHDSGPELIDVSELLKDAGERQDQVYSIGRSVQKSQMDSNRDRLEGVSFLQTRGYL